MQWAVWAGVAISATQVLGSSDPPFNVSEALDDAVNAGSNVPFAAVIREAPLPGATPLPAGGISMTIGPGESHVYEFETQLNSSNFLTVSECVRLPVGNVPLSVYSGSYEGSTHDGGLLEMTNFTSFNRTLHIVAPDTTFPGSSWTYQLGIDSSASYVQDDPGLFWVDSDFVNSLFVTELYKNFSALVYDTPYENIINQSSLNSTTQRFDLFLRPSSDLDFLEPSMGSTLNRSFCALQGSALLNQNNADFSTTDRSNNISQKLYRGQFLMKGLNRSTNYAINLAIPPSTPGYTGGMLFSSVPFVTKNSTSCQLIYNMSMCPQTAFSVPGNASVYTSSELSSLYNDAVAQLYSNFTKALDQVNCNDTAENRFSVFYGCDECASAYRDWLCTVAVPRCADWSNDAPYLQERLPGESRNDLINKIIRPAKYKEILPCYWLCNMISTYCPAAFGFQCPTGRYLNESYGWPSDNGDVTCSYPGAVYRPDGAWLLKPSWAILITAALLCLYL